MNSLKMNPIGIAIIVGSFIFVAGETAYVFILMDNRQKKQYQRMFRKTPKTLRL